MSGAPAGSGRGRDGAPEREDRPEGADAEHPLGDDARFFEPTGPGTLRETHDLVDAEGDDIRMYTGEPVETEEGWVLPQQQNTGGNASSGTADIAGRGEWPDPGAPRAQARPADDED